MKVVLGAAAFALAAATASLPALAAALFPSEAAAVQACGADEVVWVDLDHGRYYHKAQEKFGKGSNGGYSCLKTAHGSYHEGHE